MATPANPMTMLRSRSYLGLLVLAAILGVPVSAAAYGFLALVSYLQKELFHGPPGLALTPLVIVAVVVDYVTAARLTPRDAVPSASPAQPAAKPDAADAAAA